VRSLGVSAPRIFTKSGTRRSCKTIAKWSSCTNLKRGARHLDGRAVSFQGNSPAALYGYSAGKWVDDTTLVGRDHRHRGSEKVWLDEAGRPASDAMHVEERFHRVDQDRLELTVTIDDPKMYTKPWVALNKFPMRLQSPDYDVVEMMCIPSEMEQYYKDYGDPASGVPAARKIAPKRVTVWKQEGSAFRLRVPSGTKHLRAERRPCSAKRLPTGCAFGGQQRGASARQQPSPPRNAYLPKRWNPKKRRAHALLAAAGRRVGGAAPPQRLKTPNEQIVPLEARLFFITSERSCAKDLLLSSVLSVSQGALREFMSGPGDRILTFSDLDAPSQLRNARADC